MKKFLIAAAGLSAIAAAAPAAAQYYPGQPQQYGYGQQYGYASQQYGYNQQGLVQSYLVRADQLRRQVERGDTRNRISEREARRLRAAAIDLQNRTRSYARNGLSNNERIDLDRRFASLQTALRMERRDRDNRVGTYDPRYGGQQGYANDRDRDGVPDNVDRWIDLNGDGYDDYGRRY